MKQYEILLKKAKVDFRAAQNLLKDILNGDVELDYEVVLFHLHQSAEKFMKANLAFNKIEFPKVHDLELLAKLCDEHNISTGLDLELLIELSDYAVEGRYSFVSGEIGNIKKYVSMLDKAISGSNIGK